MSDFLDLSDHFLPGIIRAGMTLFPWQIEDEKTYATLAERLNLDIDKVVILGQTHSDNVLFATKPGKYNNHDAAVSCSRKVVLTIRIADCIPFLLFDVHTQNLAVIHAGWRGVENGIISKTLDQMAENGSKVEDIKVFGGPSLQQCCFEVGPEVAEKFNQTFLREGKEDKSFLDSFGAGIKQFMDKGIKEDQIIMFNECTKCTGHKYHSYRRDGSNSGRMIAMIGFQE